VAGENLTTWPDFRKLLLEYAGLEPERRSQMIFRGQSDSSWPLKTTLDRRYASGTDDERDRTHDRLQAEFRREAIGLPMALDRAGLETEWLLLSRHHGLPTPILDFTRSPYIAAFFAFAAAAELESKSVTIWIIDRSRLPGMDVPGITILEDEDAIWLNPRAVEQRAVSLWVHTGQRSTEELLGDALIKADLPSSDRRLALADLDEMGISSRGLFRDLEAVARTAAYRVIDAAESHDEP